MMHYLCISVTLLDPMFHGKGDGDAPEWPPSPLRLFQALLCGARTGCRNAHWSDVKADAFRWLEERDPPLIVAPEAKPMNAYTLFVPNNDSDRVFDRQKRLTSKVARPQRVSSGQTLHYLWRIDGADSLSKRHYAELLCSEARHLLALGWGIDQVVGHGCILHDEQIRELPGVRWKSWPSLRSSDGDRRRVPRHGTLADLEYVYHTFVESVDRKLYRPPAKPSVFNRVTYLPETVLPPRPHVVFELRDLEGRFRPSRQQEASVVSAWVRSAACRVAKSDSHEFPGGSELYVAGHIGQRNDSPSRFSYLPLPTIRRSGEHADGMIRRVMIAEPFGGSGEHARWAAERLRAHVLIDKNEQPKAILTESAASDPVALSYASPMKPRMTWSSVTPVILPGFDDSKVDKRDGLVLRAICQAGLPVEVVESYALRKAPFWTGAHHPQQYHRPDYLRHYPAWHMYLRFRKPISGPLAIGAGRHCGLGLFAAVESS